MSHGSDPSLLVAALFLFSFSAFCGAWDASPARGPRVAWVAQLPSPGFVVLGARGYDPCKIPRSGMHVHECMTLLMHVRVLASAIYNIASIC